MELSYISMDTLEGQSGEFPPRRREPRVGQSPVALLSRSPPPPFSYSVHTFRLNGLLVCAINPLRQTNP